MATNTPTGGAPKLKLKFGGGGGSISSAPAPAGSPPADAIAKPAKRKYNRKPKPDAESEEPFKSPITNKTAKKRARKDEDDEELDRSASRKVAKGTGGLKLRISSISKPPPQQISVDEIASSTGVAPKPSNTISFKKKTPAERLKVKLRTPSQIVRLVNNKAASQLPPREPGAGYDSEAESVEDDPAIEQQFVLRMLPGPDCDYLREAIENRKIGVSVANGGADVRMRFLQRDGRRAMLSIRGNNYVAFLMDLPTIVESLKSWDRKNFYKTADIHQILLVTQAVKDESEARSAEVPGDIGIDPGTWQYPHGLTPPMHWVRKRRFRKRVNQRTIEEVEEEVERLLDLDDQCVRDGGSSMFTVFDPHANDDDGEDDVDADGEDEYDGIQESIEAGLDGMGEDEEDDDLALLMAAELGREDIDDEDAMQGDDLPTITGRVLASPETMTQENETPVDAATRTQTQATTAAPSASSSIPPQSGAADGLDGDSAQPRATRSDEEDEEDSDDQDDEEDELDEEEQAAQQEKAQQREEIVEMEQELEELDKRIASMSNQMLKMRFTEKREKLVRDLKLKKMNMGDNVESDEE